MHDYRMGEKNKINTFKWQYIEWLNDIYSTSFYLYEC